MPSLRLLVVGASQGTGALTVSTALARGQQVTAFARSPQKLPIEHPALTKQAGSFHDAAAVDAAVVGHDAVIITAAPSSLAGFKENPNYVSAGTARVIEAMKRHGVRRLVVLSSLGTGESRVLSNWFIRTVLIDRLLKAPSQDHERQEALTRATDLDWVIARPGRLSNGPAQGRYVMRAEIVPVPGSISRADVADFLVTAAVTDTWVGKAVQIGG